MYDLRFRHYDPNLRIFLSPDPLGYAASGFDLWLYVGGDPLNYIDPFGLEPEHKESTRPRAQRHFGQTGGGGSGKDDLKARARRIVEEFDETKKKFKQAGNEEAVDFLNAENADVKPLREYAEGKGAGQHASPGQVERDIQDVRRALDQAKSFGAAEADGSGGELDIYSQLDDALSDGIDGDFVDYEEIGDIGRLKNRDRRRRLDEAGYDPDSFKGKQFDVTDTDGDTLVITVFEGEDEDGNPVWYYPHPSESN